MLKKEIGIRIKSTEMLTDNDLMPFGKYKGEKMVNVPATYLLFMKDKIKNKKILEYIEDNIDVLDFEVNSINNKN
ncbi:MAG TPA: hypothetical protein DC057_05090 [Spirochaetia bacterium]|nr:hypothetical protein [Spirochaetia bacterium]